MRREHDSIVRRSRQDDSYTSIEVKILPIDAVIPGTYGTIAGAIADAQIVRAAGTSIELLGEADRSPRIGVQLPAGTDIGALSISIEHTWRVDATI
ncbi:hypothetical protein BH09PLA1_BH09PLA1_15370 [soil metagenome]